MRQQVRRVVLAGALGCSGPSSHAPSDALAYRRALAGEPESCGKISSAPLRSECVTFAAQDLASRDPEGARQWCERLEGQTRRDECGFLICDTLEVTVTEARACCAAAGQFETRCLGHAVSREVYTELTRFEPGQEDAAWRAAQRVSVRALGPGGAERAMDLFVRFLVDRSDGTWLRAADCGTAPAHLCRDAYAELVAKVASDRMESPPEFVRAACARTVSVQRATSLGLPGWDPAIDGAVQQAFRRMCAR